MLEKMRRGKRCLKQGGNSEGGTRSTYGKKKTVFGEWGSVRAKRLGLYAACRNGPKKKTQRWE